jgi:hypothetical protein
MVMVMVIPPARFVLRSLQFISVGHKHTDTSQQTDAIQLLPAKPISCTAIDDLIRKIQKGNGR